MADMTEKDFKSRHLSHSSGVKVMKMIECVGILAKLELSGRKRKPRTWARGAPYIDKLNRLDTGA